MIPELERGVFTDTPTPRLAGFETRQQIHRVPDWSRSTPSGMPTVPQPFTAASRTRSGRHWNTAEQVQVAAAVAQGVAAGHPAPDRSPLGQARQLLACVREILVIILLVALVVGLARAGWSVLPSAVVS